ncbi:MAG: CBS domain-containing protein [Gemmatimonadales bacterium]
MSIGRICSRVVATATPEETIRTAARRMVRNDVGTLVVVEGRGDNHPVGVVTDRDIAVRCVGGELDPDLTPISALMSSPVRTAEEHTPIEEAMASMARAGIRRLVVTGPEGRLAGLLSLDDMLELLVGEVASIGALLEKQHPRVPA